MANDYDMPPLRPEPERDSYGRYILPDPSDPAQVKHFTRATTLAKALDDTYNLMRYRERNVVSGLKVKPELLDSIDLMEDDRRLRDVLQDVAEQAYDAAGGNEASTRGTQLHYFTEAVDTGALTLEQVPAEYRAEVAAYVAAMDRHGIARPAEGVERIVYNAMANIVGTADRLPVVFADGTRMVADVKSGRDLSYSWGAIACQLAIYADADAMVSYNADGEPFWDAFPVVEKDVGLVMHIPVDKRKCDLYIVDLAAGRAAVELAIEVREYRRRKNLARPLPVGRFGMPAAQEVYAGTAMARVTDAAGLEAAAERISPAPADPFASVPADPEDAPLAVVTNNEVPQGGGIIAPLDLSQAPELDPLEEAQALLDTAKDKAADARAGRKRRNSKQVAADKLATQAETAIPNAEMLTEAALALAEAYGFSLEDELDPETPTDDTPEQEAVDRTEARPEPEPEKDDTYPLPAQEVLPIQTMTTRHGVHVARQEGESDESLRRRVRIVELTRILEREITSPEDASAAFQEYKDVWDGDYHTNVAKGRLNELARQASMTTAQPADPIKAALDECRTAADMAAVWERFQDSWTPEYTEYGQSVLQHVNG